MQKKDTTLIRMRESQLVKAYGRALEECGEMAPHLTGKYIMCKALSYPTPRFYLTEDEAMHILRQYRKTGAPDHRSFDTYREQAEEVMARYTAKKTADIYRSDIDILCEIVNEEAPKMYLTPDSAYHIYRRAMGYGR